MNQPTATARIDVRILPPRERYPLVLSTFAALPAGETMELINDCDPAPLRSQFQARMPGQFGWEYLEQGPDTWRVVISKVVQTTHGNGRCCGSCGAT
jgi:uncharacterized protein (DUF2249 family)